MFIDWQSRSAGGDELADPARSQYKEFFITVNAMYGDEEVAYCPYIWVDRDFALARGWIQGFPKKLGSIWMTRTFGLDTSADPGIREGSTFAGTCAANDRRLAEGSVTLERASAEGPTHNDPPIVNVSPPEAAGLRDGALTRRSPGSRRRLDTDHIDIADRYRFPKGGREVAELTTLEEKLAEVLGLAQAAQRATEKVEGMVDDDEVVATLKQMRKEAEETERRCTELADRRRGQKTAILEKAQETKGEATDMMSTYLGDDSDGLDGFEFLTMAEAGEVGHWAVLGKLNESANEGEIADLVEWALPIQERHFENVKNNSLKLAGQKDPYEES